MPQKPTQIREWATGSTALIQEPADSYKRIGFPVSQPPVNFFNWIFNNIYKWIAFFNESISSGGFLYHIHQTARSRIQVPFTLPETNKISSLQILKREEALVGGVSNTAYSGTGAVTAGTGGSQGLTFLTTPDLTNDYYGTIGLASGLNISSNTISAESFVTREGVLGGSGFAYNTRDENGNLFIINGIERGRFVAEILSNGNARSFQFPTGAGVGDTESERIIQSFNNTNPNIYMLAGNSASEVSLGKCIIWDVTAYDEIYLFEAVYFNRTPVYKNIDPSIDMNHWRLIRSYTASLVGGTGSSVSTEITLDNSSPFNLANYAYNPSAQTIIVTLSGTVSATAFHTLVIRQGGQDIISLLASNATYDTTAMSFTWSGINSDPLLAGGSSTFSFQTSGSGLPAYNFIVVSTGLSVETYGSSDYLNIETGSGIVNNDVILIRKVGS